jgi:hypothetical protein
LIVTGREAALPTAGADVRPLFEPAKMGTGKHLGALDAGAGLSRLAHWNDGPSRLKPHPLGPFRFPNEKPGFWPGESKTFRT